MNPVAYTISEINGSITINVEPIPFAGMVTLTENAPKFKDLTDDEIEQHYIEYFKLTHIYGTSQRRKNFVNFAKSVLKKAQEK
jgi:hypothetical protein